MLSVTSTLPLLVCGAVYCPSGTEYTIRYDTSVISEKTLVIGPSLQLYVQDGRARARGRVYNYTSRLTPGTVYRHPIRPRLRSARSLSARLRSLTTPHARTQLRGSYLAHCPLRTGAQQGRQAACASCHLRAPTTRHPTRALVQPNSAHYEEARALQCQ